MTSLSVWVLSIAGIVLLSVVLDLILPSGSTANFIKNIFAYVIILVIISPIFSFLTNRDISVKDYFSNEEITIQNGFVSSVNKQILNNLESQIEFKLKENGINGVEVGIMANIFENKINISQVSVDLTNLVIDENIEHINIKTSIENTILQFLDIRKENIIFYE